MKKQIAIGIGDAAITAKGLIDTWRHAERGERVEEVRKPHKSAPGSGA